MRKLLVMFFLLALVACGKNDTVTTPDHKAQIDDNTARIEALEKRVSDLENEQNGLAALLNSEVARLDQADEDNLETVFEALEDQAEELEDMIRDGDRRLCYKISNINRQLRNAIRNNSYSIYRLYGELSDLEEQFEEAVEELQEADEELSNRIKKANKKRRKLARKLARFQAYQANRDRGQDMMVYFGFSSLSSYFNSQLVNVYQRLDSIDGEIDDLQNTTNGLSVAIDTINNDLSSLSSVIQNIQVNLSGLSGDIEDLGEAIEDLEDAVGDNSDAIEELADSESDSCSVSFRNVHSHGRGRLYADIFVTCDDRSVRIKGHAYIGQREDD